MTFHCRYFTLEDDCSTLKAGTDAMLLGAWTNPPPGGRILDVGTGCGILALMMAQKSQAIVEAIEPDSASARQALDNFRNSAWSDRLLLHETTFQSFCPAAAHPYDHIITNPPFYANHLVPADVRKRHTKHHTSLSFTQLLTGINLLLKPGGTLSLILPAEAAGHWMNIAGNRMSLRNLLRIKPNPGKPAHRFLLDYINQPGIGTTDETLTIRDDHGRYTADYLKLTAEFHLFRR